MEDKVNMNFPPGCRLWRGYKLQTHTCRGLLPKDSVI